MIAPALVFGLLALSAPPPAAPPYPRGYVFYQHDFESADRLPAGTVRAAEGGGQVVTVEKPQPAGSRMVWLPLPAEAMRGYTVRFTARIKAQNVGEPPQSYNGVKFMAAVVAGDEKHWPAARLPTGTFDWQTAAFGYRVPDDATKITLGLGLEAVSGKAWFDDVKVSVWKAPIDVKPRPADYPIHKGHALPRLRGAMVGDVDDEDLRVFGREWNANLVRWQLKRQDRKANPLDMAAYNAWLDDELRQFDAALASCTRHGLLVALDLHSPPGGKPTNGGYSGSDHGLFTDRKCQQTFVDNWRKIAARYKGNRTIWGFDLANEPVETPTDELADWHELATRAARAVHEVDPERTMIVESPDWGGPRGFVNFEPIDVPRVVYSVHMYEPGRFTHQGVHRPSEPIAYPGQIDGKHWDKAALERVLTPVFEFQQRYRVRIFLGEFSAIRWAPGDSAYRYLRDVVDIAEDHDWDWTYHAFREWDGWSVEHGPDRRDRQPTAEPTDRQKLLRAWYAKNQKPAGP